MGSSILFAAGPEDMKELNAYIHSLGLYLVPPGPNWEYSDDETVLGGCYISLVPQQHLRLDPRYPERFSARNPILMFTRSVYKPPYLRPGDIYWSNDSKEVGRQTAPVFKKIARWVRKNWPKPEGYVLYAGPDALQLVAQEKAIITSLVPGVTLTRVPVHSND